MNVPSEAIEPTAAMLVASWRAACEEAEGDPRRLEDACGRLWMGLLGLQKFALATPSAVHFGVACGSNMVSAARYIETRLGIDPLKEWIC